MINIVLLAEDGCILSGVTGTMDSLGIANVWWQFSKSGAGVPLFHTQIATLGGKPIIANGGIELKPHLAMEEVEEADLILLPAMFPPFDMKADRLQRICRWTRDRYENTDWLAAACTGSFFLAEAGLLDGRTATTNWLFADQFRVQYPQVNLCADQIITEDERIITAGAASAYLDLCLYITEKFGSPALASQCSKNLLLDPSRSQAPYMAHGFWKNHSDQQILQAQLWMEENYSLKIQVDDVASNVGISPRHFARRFKQATGETPVSYIQHLRIEKAKERLETTMDTVSEITWKVGYEDINSFRRLFIKHTGIPPKEYRARFAHYARD